MLLSQFESKMKLYLNIGEMLDHLRFTKPRISEGEQKRERADSEWQRLKGLFVFIIKEALIKGGNKTNTKQKIITTAVTWKKNTRTDTTLCYLYKQQQKQQKMHKLSAG